jgi:lipopolysaccharide transport system permease protein
MVKPSSVIVIAPPGRIPVPDLRHLWESREVLLRFGARDITLRYRQTALGVAWVLLQPLLTAGIFTVVFGQVAKLPTGDVPYFLFSFGGMLAWNLFSGIVTRATGSLVSNSALVSKVFFPRILVPLSTACSAALDFAVTLVFLGILLAAYGIAPGWGVFLIPVWFVLIVMIACGIGSVLSALMVRYRDIQYVVPFLLQLGLYISPIAYSISAVPHRFLVYYNLNPLTWIIGEFRWSTLDQAAPPAWQIIASFVVAIVVFAGGVMLFEKLERPLADVI